MLTAQCRDITQYLTASVQELGIGTYVSPSKVEGSNPYRPIATATLQTTVFDVVHMFSEQGISAVPIVDENGKVLNLYETVDVIVSSTSSGIEPSTLAHAHRLSSATAPSRPSTSPSLKR
jgi:CBS-domain-containing membrane protein